MTRHRHLITDDNRKWWTLGAMCFALFMVMLDNTVVNVALPSIQRDLHASISGLEWIDQRLHPHLRGPDRHRRASRRHLRPPADVPGRRDHLRRSPRRPPASRRTRPMLVAQPRVQGIGAALMMPATLSIITHAFPAARARQGDRHLGRRLRPGALDRPRASAASSPSTSAGGRSSSSTSRSRSAPSPRPLFAVRESRDDDRRPHGRLPRRRRADRRPDGDRPRPDRGQQLGLGLDRDRRPARRRLRRRSRSSSRSSFGSRRRWSSSRFFTTATSSAPTVVAFIITFAMMGIFFFIALYMQDILGYSPLEAGLRFLPTTLMIAVSRADRGPAGRPLRAALADERRARRRSPSRCSCSPAIDVDTTYSGLLPALRAAWASASR